MSHSPVISRILTLPSLDGTWQVGIELNDGRIGWGVCVVAPAGTPQPYPPSPNTIESLLKQRIAPLLVGQPLSNAPNILAQINQLTETTYITVKIPPPPQPKEKTMSRRALLLGQWQPKPLPEPTYEQRPVERSVHPAGAYGISHAIQQLTDNPKSKIQNPKSKPPLWLTISQKNIPATFYAPIAGWGYDVQNQADVGENGKIIQRRLRQLKIWLDQHNAKEANPTLFLHLHGHFGNLFGDTGKVLGALVGLEQVAKPYPLTIIDPIILDDLPSHIAAYKKLKSYMRIRRMTVKLAVSAWIRQPTDLDTFAPAGIDTIYLNAPDLGTLQQTQAIIQATDLPTIIAGDAQMATVNLTAPLIVPYEQAVSVYNTLMRQA